MHIKWLILLFTYAYVIDKIFGIKTVLFNNKRCILKNNILTKSECSIDNDTSLSFIMTTDKEIKKFNVLSNLNLYIYGNKNVIQLKGLRTEFCVVPTQRKRPNLMSLINKGIYSAENNYPQQCPFLRNTTYFMRHMQFDATLVPSYLQEYNFTYFGKVYMNNALTIEIQITGAICNVGNDCR